MGAVEAAPPRAAPARPERSPLADHRGNNFDLLRLFAALLVILSHAYPLSGSESGELALAVTGAMSFGELGVIIFFVISGYLITQSWLQTPQLLPYAAKRALRILPGLYVVVLVAALVLGPLTTALPLGEYLRHPWTRDYVAYNVRVYPLQYFLPGVFADNPLPQVVNGSLWTLPIEMTAYVLVALLGLLGVFRYRAAIPFLVLGLLWYQWRHMPDPAYREQVVLYMRVIQLVEFTIFFLIGACYYLFRDRIPLNPLAALFMLLLWVASFQQAFVVNVAYLALPYVVICAAFKSPRRLGAITRWGDLSYGTYLYAFPVQQTLAHFGLHQLGLAPFFLLSALSTLPLAAASWFLVERPCLGLKRFLPRRRAVSAQPRSLPAAETAG